MMPRQDQLNDAVDRQQPGAPDVLRETQRIVSRPQFVVRHTASSACEFGPHSHSSLTVTAVLAGTMLATIGEKDFDLSAGQTALTDVGQVHSASVREIVFVSIGISSGLVNELVTELGLTRTSAEVVFRTSAVRDELLIETARALSHEMEDEKVGQGAMLDALVRQLTIHLLRSHMTVRKSARIELSRAGPVDRRLRRAIEFMHDNYSRELALEEIASAAHLSEYHFARLFKQITSVSPHVYLANLRLERSRKLLAETALPISQIAAMVGYQSQSHFTKIFKSVTGVTPRVYRRGSRV
ncbi:MAG TPA: AraC family transcriptional regulator [Blastocatellia bacterium]|jgi:AraC family transcriptional regulator|nr:AraC family transcriptional regulator [Blastocatellia bacterium]